MDNKKSILFLSLILNIGLVSAQGFNGILSGVQRGIGFLFGDVAETSSASLGEIMFIKLLVFFLLFAIIDSAVRRIPQFNEKRAISLIISIVVSLIAIRYITTTSLINFIWLPYGVLGIVLAVLLPFIIGFFFIEGFESSAIRRFGWVTFLVIFGAIGYMRWDDLATGGLFYQNLAWIYVVVAVVSGLLFLFDGQVRTLMFMSSLKGVDDVHKRAEAAKVTSKIEEDRATLAQTSDPQSRKALEKRIKQNKKIIRDILKS